MADRLALAVRSMTARRHSICPACGAWILRGQRIAMLVDPRAWVHERCVPVVAETLKRIAANYPH